MRSTELDGGDVPLALEHNNRMQCTWPGFQILNQILERLCHPLAVVLEAVCFGLGERVTVACALGVDQATDLQDGGPIETSP